MTIEEKIMLVIPRMTAEQFAHITHVDVETIKELKSGDLQPGQLTVREGEFLAKVYDASTYTEATGKETMKEADEMMSKLVGELGLLSHSYSVHDEGMANVFQSIIHEVLTDDSLFIRLMVSYTK
ncbi:hypothetical protein [Levilactobacillus wangkuiensis]|uniref:hypothetical protein n=1 Tax=Levilactobacillus wangkuiensis TaxID=2799566 RepID=UPI00194309D7|nr:hypothetical protein [Levilactobacillus wangkuiensis]